MGVQLLLAPAAAGKTQHCIDCIQQVQRDDSLAQIWVVLPDAVEVQAFRRRLAQAGGAINVQTGTFYTLYAELLAVAGQSVARLDDPFLHRLLRTIVAQLHDDGKLAYYAPLRDKPGFFSALRAVIQELKRARAQSQDFLDAVEGRGPRLQELATIYLGYQSWLYESPWADAEGQGWLAALALEEHADLCTNWRLLVVDGFDQFNPTQLEVLRRLTEQAQATLITLTGAEPARLAHRRFDRARAVLESTLDVKAEALPGAQVRLSPPLAHLEATLFEPAPSPPAPCGDALVLLEAPNRVEEVRAALRWLKMRHVYDGIPLDGLAVLARDLEPYRPFLEETAEEFGLPLALAQGARLNENPAVAALLDLTSLPLQNWPRRLVVEAWRSPYFDWSAYGIEPADADLLDAAARHGQVIAGLDQWHEVLGRLASAKSESEDDGAAAEDSEETIAETEVPTGPAAATLRAKFDAFVERLTPPRELNTYQGYVAWLEALIGDDPELVPEQQTWQLGDSLGIVARARHGQDLEGLADFGSLSTAGRDVAALRRLKDILRGLVFAELTFGESGAVPYARFWQELRGAVEATGLRGPDSEDQSAVLAAPVLVARGLSFHAAALLGLSEGEFPRAPEQDPLLRESDREMLREAGVELETRLLSDEVTIFYEAVTLATDRLLVTRSYLADDGQLWEPSPYWEQLGRLIDAQPQRVRPEDPLLPAETASPPELLSAVAHALSRPGEAPATEPYLSRLADDAELGPAWQTVQAGARVLAARQAPEAGGPYEGDLSDLRRRLSRVYGPDRPWSTSRLETYAVCAYAFYAAYVLDLEPRQPVEAGYDVRQLGSMYHAILEEVFRRVSQTGKAPAEVLPEIARKIFDAAPEVYGFRPTPLWEQQRSELEQVLRRTIEALVEEPDGWKPAHFEASFGLRGAPPLELRGEDGETVWLRGYIDRVDADSDGHLRLIDYKSGSTPILARDLDEGKRVQLPLYALAARDVLGLGEPVAGMYWHIGSAKPSRLKLEEYEGGIEAALEIAVRHALAYAAGARRGDFAPKPPAGGCPPWCPAADFCWRYTARGW